MNEAKEILKIIPEETKKEIYRDGIKPTLVETGKTMSLIPRIVKGALAKVEMWCLNREFIVKEFELELQQKLEKHKSENIVDADPSIFIPSAQAISYNWDKEDIKQLYLNLMTADMDKETKTSVHPSFTEVIKQMDSVDVRLFTEIYRANIIPIYKLAKKEDNGNLPVLDYLLPDSFYMNESENKIIKSLNNLERLKLISIPYGVYYVNDSNYSGIENGERITKYKNEYLDKLEIEKGMINKTEYGMDFFIVCCN